MADYEIDRLNIGVEVDDGQASRDITKVTEEVQNLGDAISSLPESHALQNLGEEAEGASSKLKGVAETVENVKRAIGIDEALDFARSTSQVETLDMKLQGLGQRLANVLEQDEPNLSSMASLIQQIQSTDEKMEKLNATARDSAVKEVGEQAEASTIAVASMSGAVDKLSDSLRDEADSARQATSTLNDIGAPVDKASAVDVAISNAQSAQSALNKELERAGIAGESASKGTDKVVFSLKDLYKQIEGLKKNPLSKILKVFGAPFMAPFNNARIALKDIQKRVDGLGARLKRVALYRAMREGIHMVTEGIKEGINNAYEWARIMGNEFAGSMDSLATSSLYLKNSLGALAMPLINIVAPAVEKVIDLFVLLLNTVNKLLARIGGRATWVKAVRYPTSYGEALDDATGSAKALEKELITILGIDEINPMEGANDSGRGSGSGGADAMDYSSMFEEVELEADALDDFLEKMFDPFVKAWETKGKGVTKAFDNALGGIKSTAEAVGTSFWTVWTNGTGQESIEHILGILTGILNTIGNIGTKFAEGWNTDNLGTDIIQNLWDSLNSILKMWEDIATATADWADNLDFEPIIASTKTFTDKLKPLVDLITDGLYWGWTNVLLPLAGWTIEEGLPALIETVATALDTLRLALEYIKPFAQWAWDYLFKPLIDWTADVAVQSLKDLTDSLNDLNKAMEGTLSWEESIGSIGERIIGSFAKAIYGIGHAFMEFAVGVGKLLGQEEIALQALKEYETNLGYLAEGRWSPAPLPTPTYVVDPENFEFGKTPDPTDILGDSYAKNKFRIPVIAEGTEFENHIPEGSAKVDKVTAEVEKTNDKLPQSEKYIGGLTGGITGKLTREGTFNPTVGGLTGSITGKLTREGKFNPVVGGLTAGVTKTDTSKLSTAAKTIASVANFQSLQTNWNSSVSTSGKSPMWGAKANFTTLQTNWNSSISTSGKAVMWGAKANFTALQTNWNSGIQTDPSDKKKPRWGALANFTNLVTGWKSGSTTWDAVANFWKALTGWANDYLTWDAFAKFVDWETTFGKPTIKANIQADKIITKGGATLELKALGGAFYGGKWHDIPQYASGTLNAGSMFIAGEAGAELVGHIGGRTEVLNQSQLASTMYASVASANANQNRLLQEQNNLLRELINKQGNMRAYITSGDVVEGLTQRNRRDGRTVVAVGG